MSARQARAVMAVLIALHGAGAVFFVPFGWEPGDSLWDKVLFASLSSVLARIIHGWGNKDASGKL